MAAGWFAGLVNVSFGQPWKVIGAVLWFVAASRPRPGLPCMVSSTFTAGFCSLPEAGTVALVGAGASGVEAPQAVAPTARTTARIVTRIR
jgi:hypothetical protein